MNSKPFEWALHRAAHKDRNLKALAYELGVNEHTLRAQLNPDRDDCHFQARYLPTLLEFADDNGPLDALEAMRGRLAVPIPGEDRELCPAQMLAQAAAMAKEGGEAVAQVIKAVDDGRLSDAERDRCRREVWEALQVFGALFKAL